MRKTLIIICSLFTFILHGQNFLSWKYNDRYFTLHLGTGTSTYFGELNSKKTINDRLNVINLGIEARLLSRIGARLEVDYFTLSGNDANATDSSFQRQRNLSFKSNNFQIQLSGIYYLRPYNGDYYKRWSFNPYFVAGIGYSYYVPYASLGGERINLRPLRTEGNDYNSWVFSLPFGAGAKFKINDFINIGAEISYHITFTDYLDDVSTNYTSEFSSETAAILANRKDEAPLISSELYDQIVPGTPRGEEDNTDSYLMIRARLEFYLPPSLFRSN